ncbi:cyanophycinase [uncultured Sphingomonas sp.]|uniref:cyanophycinase n=1 Tax=uncultured Sphingomonas sp. TaxID=158754 RepID=UPI0035C99261
MTDTNGPLIIIGGHEDKEGDRAILAEVARRVAGGRLVIATVASRKPEGYFDAYREAMAPLGVTDLVELYLDSRDDAFDPAQGVLIEGATGVFFSGGDQQRIADMIRGTPVEQQLRRLRARGGVIAGTSAGASMMGTTMMVGGASEQSHRIGDLRMTEGLGLIQGVIIDQHFAERGRIGRLLGAVAAHPEAIGIGIDEDTAIVVEDGGFSVIGDGAVTIVDASGASLPDRGASGTLSIRDVRLHLLSEGNVFDLAGRIVDPRAAAA